MYTTLILAVGVRNKLSSYIVVVNSAVDLLVQIYGPGMVTVDVATFGI
jgi:hypothetical protein